MTAASLIAVLTTGIAIGAAGHAAFSGAPVDPHSQPSSVAAAPVRATPASTQREPAHPLPTLAPATLPGATSAPRECRPEDGIITDCTYM
jgi:hypothetical protein